MKWLLLKAFTLLGVATLCSLQVVNAAPVASPVASPVSIASIEPNDFGHDITNLFFPLKPGTVFIYQGVAEGIETRNEMTVTSETKTILGVECVIVRDVAFEDGTMVEDTFDWYAQDKDGNVWYLGEDSRTYEDGVVTSTKGSWEAGVDGAVPGIIMLANPIVGDVYYQEYYAGEAEDQAEVLSLTGSVSVPFGSYDRVVTIEETTKLEPAIGEHKSYAAGVGMVLAVSVRGENERSELVEIKTIS